MALYLIFIFTISVFYGALMLWYWYGWIMAKEQKAGKEKFFTSVTIIIPARNEAVHITHCLNDIFNQQFPQNLVDVIVVDDHSDDDTAKIAESFNKSNLKVIRQNEAASTVPVAYKKKAIEAAISVAKGKLLITTDADCRMGSKWLASVVSYYESNNYKMIAAPVLFTGEKSLFEKFQSLDFLGLIGITCSSIFHQFPVMCNGANLAYEKEVFQQVNGFEGIAHISSGDDMLLMHKVVKKFPHGVGFLKNRDAAVYTEPQHSVKDFLIQRNRWTSKSAHYTDKRITAILIMAYLFNASLLINLAASFFSVVFLKLFLCQLLLKFIAEFMLLSSACSFFKRNDLLSVFLPAQFMHIIYVAVVGIAGTFSKQKWKGRSIR